MYTATSAELAGSLRHTHSRLVEFAEEVAFLRGEETEKMMLEREYSSVIKHENRVLNRRWWFGCMNLLLLSILWLTLCQNRGRGHNQVAMGKFRGKFEETINIFRAI